MAKIVLGMGCAHTPQLHTKAEDWALRGNRDKIDGVPFWYKGKRMKYAEVEAMRKSEGFAPNLDLDYGNQLLQRAYKVLDRMHEAYRAAKPDVMILFGNDQHEIFFNQLNPAFAILGGESFDNMPRTDVQKTRLPVGIALADPGHLPDEHVSLPGHPELAEHLTRSLVAEDFDITASTEQPRVEEDKSVMDGMPHAYGFIYKQIMRDFVIPHVPIVTNTFFPPNQPKASRCLAFGRAVGRAIEAWDSDARVCVVGSGGLSHFLVDADWDNEFLEGLKANQLDELASLDEAYYQAGSSECKSWLAAAGAVEGTGLKPHVEDYFPLFRTEGGTGSSCGFLTWS
ncbi:MAG: hypothetical protein Hens3KO_13860 [Henriciella sp.]